MHKPLKNIAVLIADDAPLNLMIMAHVLKEADAIVFTAANGKEVIQQLEEQLINIVLMDLQMPEMDGIEATTRIRNGGQLYHNIPIIAVSAEDDLDEIEKCRNAGMNDFITKPVVPAILYQKIQSLVHAPAVTPVSDSTPAPVLPSYDLTYLREIANGEADKLLMIVKTFFDSVPSLLQQATASVQQQSWTDVAGYLHKLKGVAGFFFMPEILKALRVAEDEARATTPSSHIVTKHIRFVSSHLLLLIDHILLELKNNTNIQPVSGLFTNLHADY